MHRACPSRRRRRHPAKAAAAGKAMRGAKDGGSPANRVLIAAVRCTNPPRRAVQAPEGFISSKGKGGRSKVVGQRRSEGMDCIGLVCRQRESMFKINAATPGALKCSGGEREWSASSSDAGPHSLTESNRVPRRGPGDKRGDYRVECTGLSCVAASLPKHALRLRCARRSGSLSRAGACVDCMERAGTETPCLSLLRIPF